eukprot:scaffold3701_cov192-Alexandrium_tamarense.AAC.37
MYSLTAASTITLILIQTIHCQPTAPPQEYHGPDDRFSEAIKVRDLFSDIDLNNDKKLDRDEVKAFFEEKGVQVPEGLWENEDKNRDGVIEFHEFAKGLNDEL